MLEGVATIDEIETSPAWSMERVLDANEALDVQADADAIKAERRAIARKSEAAQLSNRLDPPR